MWGSLLQPVQSLLPSQQEPYVSSLPQKPAAIASPAVASPSMLPSERYSAPPSNCKPAATTVKGGSCILFEVGEQVEYFSASKGDWIPAKVLGIGGNGAYNLNVKPNVPGSNIRKAVVGEKVAPSPESQQPNSLSRQTVMPSYAGQQQTQAPQVQPNSPYRQSLLSSPTAESRTIVQSTAESRTIVQSDAPGGASRTVGESALNLSVGDAVLYFSASENKWINAKVMSLRPDGTFDLDCKPKVKPDKIKRMPSSSSPPKSTPMPQPTIAAAQKSIGSLYRLNVPTGSTANQDEVRAQLLSATNQNKMVEVQNALQAAQNVGLHGPEVIRAREQLSALEAGGIREQAMEIVDAAIESDNWWKLQSAMAMAHSTGFDQKDVDRLQEAMRMCKKRKDDVQMMREAAQRRDAAALRTAIEVALKDYVVEKYVKPMRDELRAMEAGTFAKSQLEAAVRSKSARQMQEAINAATKAGIKENDKEAGQALKSVQTELESMALENLHRLAQQRQGNELELAVTEWRSRGVREEALAPFSKRLDGWKKLEKCRKDLETAIRSNDPAQISSALRVAESSGVSESDLQFARTTLQKIQDRERAQQQQEQERREQERLKQERVELERRREQERIEREKEQQRRKQEQETAEREREQQRRQKEQERISREKEEQRRRQQEIEREQMATQKKQAELRASAEMKLHAAMHGNDVQQLEAAIQAAMQVGLSGVELNRATEVVHRMHARSQAVQDLQFAMQASDAYRLKAAIANARHAGVPPADIERANEAVARMQKQEHVRRTLATARASRNMDMIKKSLDEARRVGLPAHEIGEVEEHLHSSQERVKSALHAAMASGDAGRLRVEIGAATDAGLTQQEILAASEHLRKLEWQQSARKDLQTAMERGDPVKLQVALQHAIAADMPQHELTHARAELGTLTQRRQAEQELQFARAGGSADALRTALRAAISAGVSGPLIDAVTADLQAMERAGQMQHAMQQQRSQQRPEARSHSPRVTWAGGGDQYDQYTVPDTAPNFVSSATPNRYEGYTVPDTNPQYGGYGGQYEGYTIPETNPQYGVPETDPQMHAPYHSI